jgi:predicted signal transduction protein with EAL and GGDEF domain
VAEGVETSEQLSYFRKQHCEEVQGFLYSPAVPEAEIRAMLRDGVMDFAGTSMVHSAHSETPVQYATPAA